MRPIDRVKLMPWAESIDDYGVENMMSNMFHELLDLWGACDAAAENYWGIDDFLKTVTALAKLNERALALLADQYARSPREAADVASGLLGDFGAALAKRQPLTQEQIDFGHMVAEYLPNFCRPRSYWGTLWLAITGRM